MCSVPSLTLSLIYLSLIGGTNWSPMEVMIGSISRLSLISMPQTVCIKVPDTYDWPLYMLRDVFVTVTLQTPQVGYMDEVRPISPLVSVIVRDLAFRQLPDRIENMPSLCMHDKTTSENSFSFERFLALFYPRVSESSKTLTNVNEVNFTLHAFPYSCLVVCRATNQPSVPLTLLVNSTSAFNEMNVLKFALGLLLLVFSDYLSQTITFYYFSGVGMAIFGSLVIALLIFVRMLPLRRSGTVLQGLFILLGSTFSLSCMLLEYVRSTVFDLLAANVEYTTIYVVTVALLSFIFLYWFHLPDMLISRYPRTLVVMKYLLRLIGATLLIHSLYLPFDEATLADLLLSVFFNRLGSKIDQAQSWSPTMASYAPRMIRLLFVILIVLLVDLCECWRLFPSKHKRRRRKSDWLPSVESDNPVSSTFIPGSPWASSSPYGEPAIVTPRYQPRKSGHFIPIYVPRSARGDFASGTHYGSEKKYDHHSRRSIGPYGNGYYRSSTYSYDLLTDDED
ncbi:hypothetical protein FBUS_03211 [Fasciolopsis buskii]|uniref:Uncharacterized protein n=1 Tax=Fasciolopsis buskii TaxID=27845 RepID=A0A8E0VGW0_9TREM|nr:hypothetical protein FBUS_03211 [Fasciolopsis buski]